MDSQLPGGSNLGKKSGERGSQGPPRVSLPPIGAAPCITDEHCWH